MSEKKRKASSSLENRPKKKQQTSSGSISIEYIRGNDALRPIIGITPGVAFPQDIRFRSYTKNSDEGSRILLQSSDHPTIDYIATEGTEFNETHLKHYIAVYDPAENKLKLTEAKHLTVRGSVRQAAKIDETENTGDASKFPTQSGTRTALTEAFGSKKSKKAAAAIAENRQLAQGVEGATIAEAITAHLKDEDDSDDDKHGSIAAARTNKPLPIPDLTADDIEEVYSLSSLIQPQPASTTLALLPITAWLDRLKANKEVKVRSRFVANRIGYLGKAHLSDPANARFHRQVQLLCYIEILIEISQFLAKQGRFTRIPYVDQWPENTLSAGTPPRVATAIMQTIFPESKPSDRAMTLLRSTILALTLHILPPSGKTAPGTLVAEPTDIQLDLAIEAMEVRKLYHEIGCTVKPPNEKDLNIWGLAKWAKKKNEKTTKDESGTAVLRQKAVFAILKFPLDFPKPSTGKRMAKR